MGLTSDDLVRALGASCGEEPEALAWSVMLVRRAQPSFAATLYSAWQAEGISLNPGLRHELDSAKARIDFYRSIAADLAAKVPGLTPIKGLEIADLYPGGLIRAMNDLDYVASGEPDLWQAASVLTADGWEIETATFSRVGGALQMMVSLLRPHPDPCQLPYGVEIASYCSYGNLGGVTPLLSLPEQWRAPAVKNMIMLLYERFEQPFRARDLVDAALLLGSASAADIAALGSALTRLRLAPEYNELASLVSQAGLGPLPGLPAGSLARGVARVSRAARSAGHLKRPLAGSARHLQRRRIFRRPRAPERWAWTAVQRLLPPAAAVSGGVLGFGLPLDRPPPDVDAAILCRRGRLAWVDTPAARFLLAVGDDVTQSAVDELSGTEAAAPVVAQAAENAG